MFSLSGRVCLLAVACAVVNSFWRVLVFVPSPFFLMIDSVCIVLDDLRFIEGIVRGAAAHGVGKKVRRGGRDRVTVNTVICNSVGGCKLSQRRGVFILDEGRDMGKLLDWYQASILGLVSFRVCSALLLSWKSHQTIYKATVERPAKTTLTLSSPEAPEQVHNGCHQVICCRLIRSPLGPRLFVIYGCLSF